MYLERLQVESEGFLAGLDLDFVPGLNVIIGARGTGKTSLIELIRYCTGAGAFTEDALSRGHQQAVAILDGGAVTITFSDQNQRYTVTRSAAGNFTYSQPKANFSCTVLAQSEVEAVGAQAAGRLHLIDRFRSKREEDNRELISIRSRLKSQTAELAALLKEMRAIADETEALSAIEETLDTARKQQKDILDVSSTTQAQQNELQELQQVSSVIATRETILNQDVEEVTSFARDLTDLYRRADRLIQPWPETAAIDVAVTYRVHLRQLHDALGSAREALSQLDANLTSAIAQTAALRASVETQSRHLRQQLDLVQAGIGQASRRVAELEEQHGRLKALANLLDERTKRFDRLAEERDGLYADLEKRRSAIFKERQNICSQLSRDLSPAIRARVTQSENVDAYQSAIISALRGSGIHYNNLAPQIAREVAPFELVQWVELNDAAALGSALGIRSDRAQTIISALNGRQLADIIAAEIGDGIALELLDGPEYKSTDRLSIGQRCTVVLPVLLGRHGDTLIIDQPEDHLDNAFIASTLVTALRQRRGQDQFIFSSHNANIPVLGEADQVAVMTSDGEHGSVSHVGPLDDRNTVLHITALMEGGIEAFTKRSRFYELEGIELS